MAEDIDRLMKHAHRIEREGKKEIAEVVYAAASEIARMRAEIAWQPIDTAPKDETRILCFAPPQAPLFNNPVTRTDFWSRAYGNFANMPRGHAYTHWMPMPSAPTAQGETP